MHGGDESQSSNALQQAHNRDIRCSLSKSMVSKKNISLGHFFHLGSLEVNLLGAEKIIHLFLSRLKPFFSNTDAMQ